MTCSTNLLNPGIRVHKYSNALFALVALPPQCTCLRMRKHTFVTTYLWWDNLAACKMPCQVTSRLGAWHPIAEECVSTKQWICLG